MSIALWAFSLAASAHAGSGEVSPKENFSLADLGAMVSISTPALSPDGRQAAVVVARPGVAQNRSDSTLVLVDTRTGAQRILAQGDVQSPAWSPGGDALAWLAADSRKTLQLVRLTDLEGAAAPVILTDAVEGAGVQAFAWSPDGGSLAYVAGKPPAGDEARFNRTFEVSGEDYLSTTYLATSAGPRPADLLVAPAAGGRPRLLTGTAGYIRSLAWRPDGRALVIDAQPGASEASARHGAIESVDVATGSLAPLLPSPTQVGDATGIRVSPEGGIAFERFRGPDPWTHVNTAAIVADGAARDVTATLDRNVKGVEWLPGGDALLVQATDHDRIGLWRVTLAGQATRLDLAALNPVSGVSASRSGALAFAASSPDQPPELYVMASSSAKPVRLTDFNAPAASRRLGRVGTLTWNNDGFTHDGVVTYPPDFVAGRTYPLLVDVHGGPEYGAFTAFNPDARFFAARGWIVFEPNYRGSEGQGERYQTAVIGDPTAGAGRDIMAGVARMTASGSVDPSRIAVGGWSWGGVMTSWLIGHHDWCAALPGALVADFADYYNQSETGFWIATLLGSPYQAENRKAYVDSSPATYFDRIRTPTLIWANAGDPNAPVTQAYALYHALKDRGVRSALLVRNVQQHAYGDPVEEMYLFKRQADWLSANCGGDASAPALSRQAAR